MTSRSIATALFCALSFCTPHSQAQQRHIDVDVNRVQGPLNKTFNMTVGAGRANEGLRADW